MQDESCFDCTFPCYKSGKKLKPITVDDLEEMGYVLCDEHTTLPIEEQFNLD